MILITGGTGLVGSHLLYQLLQTHNKVKAIYRKEQALAVVKKVFSYYTTDIESLYNKIEWICADITDIPSLQAAFKDVNYVYHCAALVSFEPDKYIQLRKINIEGTANVVNICISNGIKKLCYVSSVAAIGREPQSEQYVTEDTTWVQEDDHNVYAIAKYGAEIEVWRGIQEGVDAVIVNPGIIIGPGFWDNDGSSNIIKRVYKGMPYYARGVTGYIDVRDTVNAMQQLMESDIKNERFIAVSENLSFQELQEQCAMALQVKAPQKEISPFLLGLGWRLDWIIHKLTGRRRKLSKQMAKSARRVTKYDASKLKNTLGIVFKPMQNSIKDTSQLFLNDLKENH